MPDHQVNEMHCPACSALLDGKIGEEDMPALTSFLRAHWVALLEVKRRRKAQGLWN